MPISRSLPGGTVRLAPPSLRSGVQAHRVTAKRLDLPLATLQREVQRFVGAGILQDRTPAEQGSPGDPRQPSRSLTRPAPRGHLRTGAGHRRRVRPGQCRVGPDLRLLGRPAPRRTLGPPPNAAAARVIGDLDRVDVYGTADRAQERLGKQVNPVIWTPGQVGQRCRLSGPRDQCLPQRRDDPRGRGGLMNRRPQSEAQIEQLIETKQLLHVVGGQANGARLLRKASRTLHQPAR